MMLHPKRLGWIDHLKAIALVWIFINHVSERLFGSPWLGNPSADWPSLSDRLAQLQPLAIAGIWHVPVNLLRYVGWLGDYGVGLFLILSGFGLAWGYLSRDPWEPFKTAEFYRRRLNRIYPLWIIAHLCILVPPAIIGLRVSLIDSALYWSILGIRILPEQLYYGVAAWWFVCLILQLYVVFPLLWKLVTRWGPARFFIVIGGGSLLIRGVGLFYFHDYLDAWNRGAIFITRLPEFAAGISLAVVVHRGKIPGRLVLFAIGVVTFIVAIVASVSLAGMTVAPLLGGIGSLAILYALFAEPRSPARIRAWIGRHSFSLYLVHQPFVDALLPKAGASHSHARLLVGLVVATIATAVAAIVLETVTAVALHLIDRARQRWGNIGAAWRLGGAILTAWALLIAGGLAVQKFYPQEPVDLGWGERPSLQPSEEFGWNLKPSSQTHLRWQSYDYHVTANSLGFPGPEYPEQKSPGTLRVLVTGDAFTSAEGVDTDQSWPRLLEDRLAEKISPRPQVLDFAITGYGPNQYLAVVKQFVPRYKPDLILIGLFINDYGDVLESNDDFRREIGFGLPDPHGIAATLTFRQLGSEVRSHLIKFGYEKILHKPDPVGYLLGHFHYLQKDSPELTGDGRQLMEERLKQIKEIAGNVPVVIVMIPSAAQVVEPGSLAYWPAHVDLTDRDRFDVNLPQRVTKEIANPLSIRCYDLRGVLKTAGPVYQQHNMHWTERGHQVAADFVAGVLQEDGYLKSSP